MQTICWRRHAIYDFFEIVHNYDQIIVPDYEYFTMAYKAYQYFIDDPTEVEILDWSEMFEYKDDFDLLAKKHARRQKGMSKKDPFKLMRDLPKKNKWLSTSLIERDDWSDAPSNLEPKGFDLESGSLLRTLLANDPDFVDLGDSRSFESADQLIEKLQIIRDSKIYIGSCCMWSNWAAENGVPTYVTFNALTGEEYHGATLVSDILPNLRKGYTKSV